MLKLGSVIAEKYVIEHLIAEGGMAELYLARYLFAKTGVEKYVAIKRLTPEQRNIDNNEEFFAREARFIILIQHKNIVKGKELIKFGDELFLVMEYIFGINLGQLIHRLKNETINIKINVALAVAYAVGQALQCIRLWPINNNKILNLVHGDISTHNILINSQGVVKLIDFGVAQSAAEIRDCSLLRGTIRYMSPEQREGQLLTQASDIYSLALVLEEIIGHDSSGHELNLIIKKAKAQELKNRFENADDFLLAIEKALLNNKLKDPQNFLMHMLKDKNQVKNANSLSRSLLHILTVGGALAFIIALVVATGTRYFYPRIPDLGLQDHPCDSYDEVLTGVGD